MLKTLMVTAAASAVTIGAAVAEGTPPRPGSAAPPPAASGSAPAPQASQPSDSAEKSAKFVSSQRPDQFLASSFSGTDVVGADNQKIGNVSDILFEKDGKIQAYVVSVGGFLGIGSKQVALEPGAFEVVPGDKSKNESDKLKLSMTKDQLQQAANFEKYRPPQATTTGAGGGARPPAGGMGR
jgi:sporulation protein YlmC with PRC-barrel domain